MKPYLFWDLKGKMEITWYPWKAPLHSSKPIGGAAKVPKEIKTNNPVKELFVIAISSHHQCGRVCTKNHKQDREK